VSNLIISAEECLFSKCHLTDNWYMLHCCFVMQHIFFLLVTVTDRPLNSFVLKFSLYCMCTWQYNAIFWCAIFKTYHDPRVNCNNIIIFTLFMTQTCRDNQHVICYNSFLMRIKSTSVLCLTSEATDQRWTDCYGSPLIQWSFVDLELLVSSNFTSDWQARPAVSD